jgi:hypothetical protein
MLVEIPPDLKPEVRDELAQLLPLLSATGWKIDRIQWDAPTARDRRIALTAIQFG